MSDAIKHECGIAMLRLLKPAGYYIEKYGSWSYPLKRMYLMMEKQHNRGQDGAGLAGIKLDVKAGSRYLFRQRSNEPDAIKEIFRKINQDTILASDRHPGADVDADFLREEMPFACDIYMGHLRYGTFGNYNIDYVHPFTRENNWRSRTLVMAGNFNMTNVDEVFEHLIEIGQSPVDYSDTVTILENMGHFLDEENERLYRRFKGEGYSKREITPLIESNIDLVPVLRSAARRWDGGYAMAGITGYGAGFLLRDPSGIRPLFYHADDEFVIAASERPVIQTAFRKRTDQIEELEPGMALIINRDGTVSTERVLEPDTPAKCSFERIYFSRGTDKSIYRERKRMGELLTPAVLKAVDWDMENTVFSYIPNTAESAFFGLVKGLEDYLNQYKVSEIIRCGDNISREELEQIMSARPRIEKIAVKDVKLRTFITEDSERDDMVAHVYDVTYGVIRRGIDNLVVIDDSIVRGTTLRNSIIKILDGLDPKRIVVVSSSPQIRYPDCYGIDMTRLGDFIAFRAAIGLLKERGMERLIDEVAEDCRRELEKPVREMINAVKRIYEPFTYSEISDKVAEILHPSDVKSDVRVVYQTVENLHAAAPGNRGDWYFSGNYPTPGGNRVANRSYINFIKGVGQRSY